MGGSAYTETRGVLRTAPDGAFALWRLAPPAVLAPFVAVVWRVEWDRTGLAPYVQSTLPHPSVHLTVEEGRAWLYGPPRRRFERVLEGRGATVGVRLRPAGARALLDAPVSAIADRRVPAGTRIPSLDDAAFAAAMTAAGDREDAVLAAVRRSLVPLLPAAPDPAAVLADRALALLEADPALVRAKALAARLGVSPRSLHRLFGEHVGVGPGWVVRRLRLQEAAARTAAGAPPNWGRLAADLGYCDQAHLVRDFTRTIGEPPARYAAALRAAGG